ncbi:MAG: response regulator [Bdellovibrionaceae bacterium]|nr:response regulator [Bdellovibrio sp.]
MLIVEDEPSIAEGIKSIIAPPQTVIPIQRSSRQRSNESLTSQELHQQVRKDQFEIVWAKNPTEALQHINDSIAKNKPFAMGFFDVLLGGDIDGIELVRQIHIMDPKIYAVFVTAYHDRTVDSINQILGPDKSDRWDYMNKPFTDGAILQKARNAVSMWNLKQQKNLQDEQLAEAMNLLLQGERANTAAAVGRSVAHEFGNLLMHIIGHAEIALVKGDIFTMQKSLGTILKAGETASAVLNSFKRFHNPEHKPEFKNVNINQSIDEAIELMGHEFKKHSIKVTRPVYHQCSIEANHHSLVQVFMNLFINASHAMPHSGQIDVSVKKINDPIAPENAWVEIKIRDHGPGIPEKILPNVMDPFFTTKGSQGTGLGLGICKEIIQSEHDGEFQISNHPAKGVEVVIRLKEKREVPE